MDTPGATRMRRHDASRCVPGNVEKVLFGGSPRWMTTSGRDQADGTNDHRRALPVDHFIGASEACRYTFEMGQLVFHRHYRVPALIVERGFENGWKQGTAHS